MASSHGRHPLERRVSSMSPQLRQHGRLTQITLRREEAVMGGLLWLLRRFSVLDKQEGLFSNNPAPSGLPLKIAYSLFVEKHFYFSETVTFSHFYC